jgi:hypothetical protein
MRFVWDDEKAQRNFRKHAVSFEEAATVFANPLAVVAEDPSRPEQARLIGESALQRVLLVVFLETDVIRIISARRATRHERRAYEEGA